MTAPVDNFAVRIVGLFGAEGRPADQTLEHDGANTPPIACIVVAASAEDFRGDVIGSSDSRVGELTSALTPCVDLVAVGYCKLDLVDGNTVAVLV